MTTHGATRGYFYALGYGLLIVITVFVAMQATPVVSQAPSIQSRYEYRVIEVLPDTRSIQSALDEYGGAGWELAAFEMGELQAPRLIFKKAIRAAQ